MARRSRLGLADLASASCAGADRRPASGAEGQGGAGGGCAGLHFLQPDVLGTAVAGLLDFLPDQPERGAGVRVGWGSVRGLACAEGRAGDWGWTGGAGGGGGGGAGAPVEVVEALPVVGGQFRLAGMQPRRGQILELMDWYERQFERLGVRLRLNTFLDDQELADHPASVVVVATGSLPDETGFQRRVPSEASLRRGSRRGASGRPRPCRAQARSLGMRWWSMTRGRTGGGSGRPGRQGAGEEGDDRDAGALRREGDFRTAADGVVRRRLGGLGVRMLPEHRPVRWHGNGVTVVVPDGRGRRGDPGSRVW